MKRSFHLLIILSFLVFAGKGVFAGNVLGDILKIYNTYQEINMTLWLAGDVGAEKRLGKELQMWMRLSTKPEKDPKINAYVKGIFDRLVPHYNSHGMRLDVRVIKDSSANAFAIPGGHVYVHTGLLNLVSTDDELAVVLAHELAHVERRHSLKNFRASAAAVALLKAAVKNRKDRETWGALLSYLTLMKFSRTQEDEADDIGQFRMAAAGFNPAAQVTVWEKFLKKYGDSKGLAAYTSSHPPSSARIQNAKNNLAKMNVAQKTVFSNTRNILSAEKVNLLPNGSFEAPLSQNGLIPGWQISEGKARISERVFVDGRRSLELISEARMSVTRVVSDFIPVNTSSDFTFTGWLRSEDNAQNAAIGIELYDAKKRLRNRVWAIRESSAVSAQGTRFSSRLANVNGNRIFTANTSFMRIVLQAGLISKGSVFFDDLRLKPTNTVDPVNLLEAGDFETPASNGLPAGIVTLSDGISIDFTKAKSGYGSLKISASKGGEKGFAFSPLDLSHFKSGQTISGSFFFYGDSQVQGSLLVDLLDASGRPLPRNLAKVDFETEKGKWKGTSFSFKFEIKQEELAQAKSLEFRLISNMNAGSNIWLDNFVAR